MVVGLGSGSTVAFLVEALGVRVQAGLRIRGIPTSERTAEWARRAGIPLIDFAELASRQIDLAVDGADEVELGSLNLIKGRGGALLREKIVARASKRFVVIVDESKIVERLGCGALPVEVVPFGWQVTARELRALKLESALRMTADGQPFVTDNGHYTLDCTCDGFVEMTSLQTALDGVTGVVDHGLFLGMTSLVLVAGSDGVRELRSR